MFSSIKAKSKFLRIILLLFLLVWITGIISPCLNINSLNSFYPFQRMLYSNVCHQDVNKSFTCNGIPFLVCARCTGIYFGALISAVVILILSIKLKFKTKFLYLLSIPMLLDVLYYSFGIYPYNKFIASSTGLLFGSSIFLYILSTLEYLLFIKQKNNNGL